MCIKIICWHSHKSLSHVSISHRANTHFNRNTPSGPMIESPDYLAIFLDCRSRPCTANTIRMGGVAWWVNIRFGVWKYEPSSCSSDISLSTRLIALEASYVCNAVMCDIELHCTIILLTSSSPLTQKRSYFYGHRNAIKCSCSASRRAAADSFFLPLPYQFPLRSIFHGRGKKAENG